MSGLADPRCAARRWTSLQPEIMLAMISELKGTDGQSLISCWLRCNTTDHDGGEMLSYGINVAKEAEETLRV